MTSEVIVDVQPKEISIALLEDKKVGGISERGPVGLFCGGQHISGKSEETYAGVERMLCERSYERDAFLHYLDLGPKFNSYTKYLKQVTSDKKIVSILEGFDSARP